MAAVETYGIMLVKGASYMYKGVRFRKYVKAEVDLATRNHLVGTKHFRDTEIEEVEPEPIPVKKKKGKVTVRKKTSRKRAEPGMVSAEGGATAGDDEGAEEV